ncbi:MAG TPA: hypothetical protein VIF62_04805 [Labilithrix sp.]
MPLPFALPIGLLVGLSLAWLSRGELARSEVPLVLARPFLVAVGLGMIVYAPVLGYFAAVHGDWTYLYLVRWSRVPSAVDLALVVACGASVPAGFALAAPWAIGKRSQPLLAVSAVIAAAVVVSAVLASRRLATSASYAQFHGGFGGAPASGSTLGRGVLSSWIALAAGYAWSAWVLRSARAARGSS